MVFFLTLSLLNYNEKIWNGIHL